jgi:hypothetical protein
MSTNDQALHIPSDSDILQHVLRMVIPMRREHNRSLEVRQFMHDVTYAKEIIDQALASKDHNLLEHGAYLSNKMFGPRNTLNEPAPVAQKQESTSTVPTLTEPVEEESEAAMRARMMSKYKTGLR